MSQDDYIIPDSAGAAFLARLNLAFPALASNNSGTTEPATMYAHMWWADTTNDILKKRNAANTGWINYMTLSTGALLGQGVGTPASGDMVNCTLKSSSPSAGIGYSAGAGGTVNQTTSKSTGVTLNKVCGEIVMHDAALAAGASVTFAFSNSALALLSDILIINQSGASMGGKYSVVAVRTTSGADITLKNETGGSLAELVYLKFAVIKGVGA